MVNIFAYTSSNRAGVGAIDKPDRFEQVLYILYPRDPRNNFHGQHLDGPSLQNVRFWWL